MKKIETIKFISKSNIIHNGKYDYSLVNLQGTKVKVRIVCPIHGEFEQEPRHHMSGSGCYHCGRDKTETAKRLNTELFINKANEKHGTKYCYDKVSYRNGKSKVTITCPKHGDFQQVAERHLSGNGCTKCKMEKSGWNYHLWVSAGEKSVYFDSFKLYIIECWNDDERFYKIGITYQTLETRFSSKSKMPYKWKVLKIIDNIPPRDICVLERELQKLNKKHSYIPRLFFKGIYECFSELDSLTFSNQ